MNGHGKQCLPALLLSSAAAAGVVRVPLDFARIQNAIDAASTGDTVLVAPGRYPEILTFRGKAITVTGRDPLDPDVVASTIVDASGAYCADTCSVVRFSAGEGPGSVLAGLTLTGGRGVTTEIGFHGQRSTVGGGIYCRGSSPTLVACELRENRATGLDGEGGGVYADDASPRLLRCVIEDNWAQRQGGGLVFYGGKTSLRGCTIRGNRADDLGGGGLLAVAGAAHLSACSVEENSARGAGGGISAQACALRLERCTVRNNSTAGVDHTSNGGGMFFARCSPSLDRCTIVGNSAVDRGAPSTATTRRRWWSTASSGAISLERFRAIQKSATPWCSAASLARGTSDPIPDSVMLPAGISRILRWPRTRPASGRERKEPTSAPGGPIATCPPFTIPW